MIEAIFTIFCVVLSIAICVTLVGKTGHSRWLGVALVIPVVNAIVIIYLLSSTWPIQRELALRRIQSGDAGIEDARIVYNEAIRMQKNGRSAEANKRFSLIISHFPSTELARDSQISLPQKENN